MSDFVSWGSLLISFCTLVVSIIAFWKRERDRRIELLQANLYAILIKVGKSDRLLLVNSGKAEARNIRIKLNGVPIEDHCAFLKGMTIPSYIGPTSQVSFPLGISHDCSPPFEIEVQWDDDYRQDRVYKSTLMF
jgi:hypothetical protein